MRDERRGMEEGRRMERGGWKRGSYHCMVVVRGIWYLENSMMVFFFKR